MPDVLKAKRLEVEEIIVQAPGGGARIEMKANERFADLSIIGPGNRLAIVAYVQDDVSAQVGLWDRDPKDPNEIRLCPEAPGRLRAEMSRQEDGHVRLVVYGDVPRFVGRPLDQERAGMEADCDETERRVHAEEARRRAEREAADLAAFLEQHPHLAKRFPETAARVKARMAEPEPDEATAAPSDTRH